MVNKIKKEITNDTNTASAEPSLGCDEDFEDEVEINIEDIEVEEEKEKNVGQQIFETRRRLEEVLQEKKRQKEENYFGDLEDDKDK